MMHVFDKVKDVQLPLTISTSAYTAGDVVGGLLTFPVPSASGCGLINGITIVDDDNEKAVLTLYLYNAAPVAVVDADPFAPTIADLKKQIYTQAIAAADYTTLNNNAIARYDDINRVYKASDNGNLYGFLVCTATPTYTAATDLTITLHILTS